MKKDIPILKIPTIQIDIQKEVKPEGAIYLRAAVKLEEHPDRITDRLVYWAEKMPNNIFLAQRGADGEWQTLTYAQAWNKVQHIAQFIIDSEANTEKPIVILSANSLEHGLMAMAAMHVGIPYAPLSPAYALRSSDYNTLRQCVDQLTPGLFFVEDGLKYKEALKAVAKSVPIVAVANVGDAAISFKELLKVGTTQKVAKANRQVGRNTIAKILFTSGSTGIPKGVINSHGNITCNWQQITQTFPFMATGDLNLIDWLPWSHTFGGNHNFGIALYNGGTLYIDDGNPTPEGFPKTLQNLKAIAPTVYFNVPSGYEKLVPWLKSDPELRNLFFSQLKMIFFAAASLPQHIYDELDELAKMTLGKKLPIASGFGMTEASPSALFNTGYSSYSGNLGVPVPGLVVKLVPNGDRFEARFQGRNITAGYWRNPEATSAAFDEEGFFKTGDTLRLIDNDNANAGLVFDGRLSEDFKLNSGTWVKVGSLRERLIKEGNGLIKDAVITGHNRSYLGAIIFPDVTYCAKLAGMNENTGLGDLVYARPVQKALQKVLDALNKEATGSSMQIKRALFADFTPSAQRGEITEKGSMNQRALLRNYSSLVDTIYHEILLENVLEIGNSKEFG
jgi:feruloyl-CoA synthase